MKCPILNLQGFKQKLAQKFIHNPQNVSDQDHQLMEDLHNMTNMLDNINNRKKQYNFKKKILEYIAPHFQFNKLIAIKDK